jgi:hypothetical protein
MEEWDALFRFTPHELAHERKRHTLDLLVRLGTDRNTVFRFAARGEISSDAIALAEEGHVEVAVIEARADESTPAGRPLWLGIAARAACVRGDRLGVVRLLRAALALAPAGALELDLSFVWENADEELRAMLDRASIPRPRA